MIVAGIFGDFDLGIVVVALFGVIILLFMYCMMIQRKVKVMLRKYDRFMRGKTAENLEETMLKSIEKMESVARLYRSTNEKIAELDERTKNTYQKIGIVRYDAFKEMGGKLSFVLALLNNDNNGFIMNIMHSREGCYSYVKEVIAGKSYIALSEEEKEALEKAINEEENLVEQDDQGKNE